MKFEIVTISTCLLFEALDFAKTRVACQSCKNFGRLWSCPPFAPTSKSESDKIKKTESISERELQETKKFFEGVREVHLILVKHKLSDSEKEDLQNTYCKLRSIFDAKLLEMERNSPASKTLFAGSCTNCPLSECPRTQNLPCPRSELTRPSLEALGFDVAKLLKKHFNLELEWKKPQFLNLLGALLLP